MQRRSQTKLTKPRMITSADCIKIKNGNVVYKNSSCDMVFIAIHLLIKNINIITCLPFTCDIEID